MLLASICLTAVAAAAPKAHVIIFGKWISVQWFTGADEQKPLSLKVRPLMVDGRVKEYIAGATHEVTERLFVVRRAFRVNDSLPEDSGRLAMAVATGRLAAGGPWEWSHLSDQSG